MATAIEPAYSHWNSLSQPEFNELMLDFEKFCEDGSMITNKNGLPVPFKLNEAQRLVAKKIIGAVFADIPRPTSVFIHKCRQMGITVVIAKVEQYICSRMANINTQHIMPVEADADDLCEKKFIPMLQATHPSLLPETAVIKRRVKFIEWEDANKTTKLNSYVDFTSAQGASGGRSRTNQIVVEDEHAHYERVDYLERGVLATMPKVGRSLRVVVSTAYGMNHFYDLSKVAQKSNHWDYMFLPWHMLAEYEMEPEGRLKELTSLTDYEVKLCGIFEECGYDPSTWARKMAWWQYTFETEAKQDMDFMYENYPSTAEESFAATGAPVLPAVKIRKLKDANKPFKYVEITQDNLGRGQIRETNLSTIKQFAAPIQGRKYDIICDPAEGGADGDDTSIVIIDTLTMECVLAVKDKLEETDAAELMNVVGRLYNNAKAIVERNTGKVIIEWLIMLKYPNMYIDPQHTTRTRAVYGVYMTWPAKREAITRLKFLLNTDSYKDYDPDFLDQAMHFVWKKTPSGLQKAIGSEGFPDDCVMSRLIWAFTLNMNKWKDYGKQNNT